MNKCTDGRFIFTTSRPIQYNLAVLLLQTNRPQEALEFLENVNYAYPDDPKTTRAGACRTGKPAITGWPMTCSSNWSNVIPGFNPPGNPCT